MRPSAFSCFIRLQRIARYSAGVGAGQENGNANLTPDTPGEGLTARARAASQAFCAPRAFVSCATAEL